jgi:hypothetical protein
MGLLLLVQGVYPMGVAFVALVFGGWQALDGAMRSWIGAGSLVCAAVVIPWWRWSGRQ